MKRKLSLFFVAVWNLAFGFLSFWWFVLSYAAAVNSGGGEDTEFLIPIGYFAIILLFAIIIFSNWRFFRRITEKFRWMFFLQIIPYLTGICLSISLTL